MLVPALIPLCAADAPVSASGSLALALAAVGVHTAAMLAVTGAIAAGTCRGFEAGTRLLRALLARSVAYREEVARRRKLATSSRTAASCPSQACPPVGNRMSRAPGICSAAYLAPAAVL